MPACPTLLPATEKIGGVLKRGGSDVTCGAGSAPKAHAAAAKINQTRPLLDSAETNTKTSLTFISEFGKLRPSGRVWREKLDNANETLSLFSGSDP
jgi:hypothetical protein